MPTRNQVSDGMDEVDVARYRAAILQTARRYAIQGHHLLDLEELQSEGWVVYTKCLNSLKEEGWPEADFEWVFRRSLRNRYIDLWRRFIRSPEKPEVVIDVSEIWATVSPRQVDLIYLKELAAHAKTMLSPAAIKLLQILLEPPDWLLEEIAMEFRRSRHLANKGLLRRPRPVKITPANIARALGVSSRRFDLLMGELAGVFSEKLWVAES